MPIPFLIAGAALAMGGVVSHCAKEVANDYKDELNSINRSMERMQHEINERVYRSKDNFESSVTALTNSRNTIYKTTMVNFSKTFSKIKNVDFQDNIIFEENCKRFNTSLVRYNNNSTYQSEFWNTTASSILSIATIGVGGLFLGSFVSGIKTSYKIDEAKAERSKLKAHCEAAELECVKIDSLAKYCNTVDSALISLNKILEKGLERLNQIISNTGIDYMNYTDQEKEQARFVVNLAMIVNDIITTDIFEKNGDVNPKFEKFVEKTNEYRK